MPSRQVDIKRRMTMRNEHQANQALVDYNQKEYEMRKEWERVLKAPAKPTQSGHNVVASLQRKPVKVGFFSKLFKVV